IFRRCLHPDSTLICRPLFQESHSMVFEFKTMDHINRLDKSCLWRIIVLLPETDRTEGVPKECLRWMLFFSSPKLTTIHDLNDDCLIVLLGKLPLGHLVNKASLVCKKWYGLVKYALRQRTELDVELPLPSIAPIFGLFTPKPFLELDSAHQV